MLDTCFTGTYGEGMARMIQIRHVPEDLHRRLKARATLEGLSLSDYLLREVRGVVERPTLAYLRRRIVERPPVAVQLPAAKAIRAQRGRPCSSFEV